MYKASVIIINYNDKVRIQRAINSALNQTWKNTEVIVVDDGSDDETRKLYREFKGKIKLIQLERTDAKERNPSRPRNAGYKESTGNFVCFLDSDNYYSATFIEDAIKFDADAVFCNWEIIGLQNYKCTIKAVWDLSKPILVNYLSFQHLDHQCLLIKRSAAEKVMPYDERFPRSQDCDFIVRLITAVDSWQYVDKTNFFFEKHEQDQNKGLASFYGKCMWTFKNGLNPTWLFGFIQKSPELFHVFNRAYNDFFGLETWSAESEKYSFIKQKIIDQMLNEQRE